MATYLFRCEWCGNETEATTWVEPGPCRKTHDGKRCGGLPKRVWTAAFIRSSCRAVEQ